MLLRIHIHGSEFYSCIWIIPYCPCVMSRRNIGYVTRTVFFFIPIIHLDSDSSRYYVLCMGCLATFSLSNRFYTFFPAPSWFKIKLPILVSPIFVRSTFPFSKVSVSSGEFILFFSILAILYQKY